MENDPAELDGYRAALKSAVRLLGASEVLRLASDFCTETDVAGVVTSVLADGLVFQTALGSCFVSDLGEPPAKIGDHATLRALPTAGGCEHPMWSNACPSNDEGFQVAMRKKSSHARRTPARRARG